MHAAPATVTQGLPSQDFAAELKAVAKTCEHIQVLLPAVWHTIHTLLQRAADMYATLPQESPTFIHGDFKADHVLVPSQARQDAGVPLTLIDFDSCRMADPALDIGKFLADLDWAYAESDEQNLVQARSAFISGYNLDPTHPRLLRARIVEALILVKITAHRVRLFDPTWSSDDDSHDRPRRSNFGAGHQGVVDAACRKRGGFICAQNEALPSSKLSSA